MKKKKHKRKKKKKKKSFKFLALIWKKSLFGSQILFLNQPKRLSKTIKMKGKNEMSKREIKRKTRISNLNKTSFHDLMNGLEK